MSRNKKILIGLGIVVVVGGVVFANFRFKRETGVAVNVEAIQKRDLQAIVSASGKIQPQRLVNISADTMGRVTNLAVEEGQTVQKGQFLLQIDPRNLTTAYNQGAASLENAKLNLSKVRIESPITGIITRRNIEEGETVVIGTMNNAGTNLLTIADMSLIEAQVEVDETDIPNVTLGQKAKITIDAMPGKTFSGKVVEIGNSPISATGTAASQATNFLVKVAVDGVIPDVRPGFTTTAEITTATRPNVIAIPIQATTVREKIVDREGNIVPDENPGPGKKRPTVILDSQLKPGQEKKELEGVFVVKDNKATFTPVKTGIAGEKYFEVISGLKEGEQVIIGPFSSVRELSDGAAVKIEAQTRASTKKS